LINVLDFSNYSAISDVKSKQIATMETSDPSININFILEVKTKRDII
jgi:hypothetical protein